MYFYERIKPVGLFAGILLMVFGIIFLTAPGRVTEFLAIFVGAVITVFGIFRIITVAMRWQAFVNRVPMFIFGLVVSIIGIFMLFNPNVTLGFVGTIIGIIAIMLAVDRFVTANRLKKTANPLPTIISGLIHLIFGIGMIYSAMIIFSVIIVLIGIYLLVSGVMFTLSALFFQDY